jgi:DNA-binding MarR family transcriptional regulator
MNAELYKQLVEWIMVCVKHTLTEFRQYSHEVGLTMPQMYVMLYLYFKGPSKMSKLISSTQGSKTAASQMVQRLVEQGLVERSKVPGDRRARSVRLSEKGCLLIKDITRTREERLKRLDEELSEVEKEEITHALRILNDAVFRIQKESLSREG